MPLRGKIGGVAFFDYGNVWPGSLNFSGGNLRFAAGPGLRYLTPVGPARIDLGYQLNPIPGLRVNGKPEARRWRLHFSIGQAF
jgi:outer membrane translocation and assembly module TamA